MPALSRLQLAAIGRMQRQFRAAANTHGPLRCVLIHKEGDDFRNRLSPPFCEGMPSLAMERGSLYSYRLYCRGPNGEEVLCKTATTGPGRNPYLELNEPVSRHEAFAGRDIYLLRNHKNEVSGWPIDPQALAEDPNWQELSRRTHESQKAFWRLAGEVGRCFGADDCSILPEVARESLEAHDDGDRWLWIIFDLAWRKVRGSPLQTDRWIWHEADGEGMHSYAWELNTDRHWAREWRNASSSRPGPDEARRIEKLAYLKAWAERRPAFYYSHLDDLFSASVWAIDILTVSDPVSATPDGSADMEGLPANGSKHAAKAKEPPPTASANATVGDITVHNHVNIDPGAIADLVLKKLANQQAAPAAPPSAQQVPVGQMPPACDTTAKPPMPAGPRWYMMRPFKNRGHALVVNTHHNPWDYHLDDPDAEVIKRWLPDFDPDNANLSNLEALMLTEFKVSPTDCQELTWPQVIALLNRREPAHQTPPGEPARQEDAQEASAEADWREVQERLLRLRKTGERFTSQRELARRLSCSAATINKAVKGSDSLKGWAARAKASPGAQSLSDVTTDNTPSQREADPASGPSEDEVDRTMGLLIEQAKSAERAKLNELNADGRREIVRAYLEQQDEKHIEDKARKGNRILDRKP